MAKLKIPEHQVAGHKALYGKSGPLVDGSGLFYKPLQSGERGAIEAAFYESFSSDTRVPDHVRRFFPKYHGTKSIEASDGSGLKPHLVLEDLISNYSNPSVMDSKIGSRTWYPQAPQAYIQKCLKKDLQTSSVLLGFRVCGLQIYGGEDLGYWKPHKNVTQNYKADDVRLVLTKFVSSNHSTDAAYASNIYGGSSGILAQLLEIKSWFEDQTFYQFNSSSVLMVFDQKSLLEGEASRPAIKLVDFAHVVHGDHGVIDHNFLGGLSSLIKFVSEILTDTSK